MKTKRSIVLILALFLTGQHPVHPASPVLTTANPAVITQYSAVCGGTVTTSGDSPVTEKGVCWSEINSLPEISESRLIFKTSGNTFSGYLRCLKPNTTYYLRAYAVNGDGTGYGDPVIIKTLADNQGTVSDIEGNVYKTVTIGAKTWFAENLRTMRYNNGEKIATTEEEIYAKDQPRYQWPSNGSQDEVKLYGRLYTWHVVVDSRDICPCGWHVPTNDEWLELIETQGGAEIAGGKLKQTGVGYWERPNSGADNSSGFSALPAGIRDYTSAFAWFGKIATFWTSTENDEDDAFSYTLDHTHTEALENIYNKKAGYSVRCVKD